MRREGGVRRMKSGGPTALRGRRALRVPALLLAAAIAVVGSPARECGAFRGPVARGAPPPAFHLKDLDGREWDSRDLLGKKVVVLVFWSTWSPRSREVLRDLELLRGELGAERFDILAVNAEHERVGAEERRAVQSFVKELPLGALVLLDEGLVTFNTYGVMALPSSIVVDAQGRVGFDLAGYPTTLRSDLADGVRRALGLPTSEELRPPQPYVPKNHALMYYNFGLRLLEKGQEEKAVEQLRIAVGRDPEFKKPHIELGLHHRRHGRLEEALREFARVRELDPGDREAAYQAAVVSLQDGGFAAAAEGFSHLATEYPDRGEYALGQALAARYLGREEEARRLQERSAGLKPPSARVYADLAEAAERKGDQSEAARLFRAGVEAALAEDRAQGGGAAPAGQGP